MADTVGATRLKQFLRHLGEVEKERFLDSTGIDVDGWEIDKARFSGFEKSLTDYRKVLAQSLKSVGAGGGSQQGPHFRCDCCGATQLESAYYVNVPRCATFCAECTNVLVHQVRNAR